MNFLTVLPLKAWGYLAAFFALLAALWRVYAAGKNAARLEGLERTLDNVGAKDKTDETIDRLPDGDVTGRLRDKWSRD